MKKRLSIVEFWRFVGAIMIMLRHLYFLGEPSISIGADKMRNIDYYGDGGWIFVEFFFILTGYFTCRHFYKRPLSDNTVRDSLEYSLKKFRPLLPHVFLAVTAQFIIHIICNQDEKTIRLFATDLTNYIYELFLMGETKATTYTLAPIWFLSALLLTLPIISLLCQLKNKHLVLYISFMYSIVYYGMHQRVNDRVWPNDIHRALAGLALGVFAFLLSEYLKENHPVKDTKRARIILTVAEFALLILATLGALLTDQIFTKLIIFAFAGGIGIMLSGLSYSSELNVGFLNYLGKLSIPIYIWQWVVATIITTVNSSHPMSEKKRLFLFFVCTLIVAMATNWLIEKAKIWYQNRKTAPAVSE